MSSSIPSGEERLSWVCALPRLLTVRHVSGMAPEPPAWLVWLLATLALVAWIGVDWLRTQPDPFFNPFGAPQVGWYVLIVLAVAAALASLSRPRVLMRSTLAAVLAVMLVIFAVAAVALFVPVSIPQTALHIGLLVAAIYGILVMARALKSITGTGQLRAVGSAVLVLAAALSVTEWLYVEPRLWYAPELEEDGYQYEEYWQRAESLMFEQPGRIDAAVAQIAPSKDEPPAAFFVGFAGYGEQRVFAEEIKLAAQVLGERYGAQARTLLLLNDRRDLDAQPIASATSLRYALKRLAARMDLEEDILFLSLSSHGSEDASLSVSNEPLMLQDLTDESLAAALHDSGIKWRVIVISACHSGSFIDALRDPHTIVITAAAADRTSFGCSDERDLTYFGEAFYRDALPGAASLRGAFEEAKAAIAQREQREGIEASDPQAHFGEAIERKLASMQIS